VIVFLICEACSGFVLAVDKELNTIDSKRHSSYLFIFITHTLHSPPLTRSTLRLVLIFTNIICGGYVRSQSLDRGLFRSPRIDHVLLKIPMDWSANYPNTEVDLTHTKQVYVVIFTHTKRTQT
jgi:hypothetical protein